MGLKHLFIIIEYYLMIDIKHLFKKYGNGKNSAIAISDLSMHIDSFELVAVVGPSGSGKTTLLRTINRLENFDGGTIEIDEQNIMNSDPVQLRRKIGYVIQDVGLFPHLKIENNVAAVPTLLRWDKTRIDRKVDELLDMVGLEPEIYKKRYPNELSGGQRQRVGLARAMAAEPNIILADEPFGAVDPINRAIIQDEFLSIQKRFKTTVIFVTHDIDEALKMGDRVAILNHGKLIQIDTKENILLHPTNKFVEEFAGHDKMTKLFKILSIKSILTKNSYKKRVKQDIVLMNEPTSNISFKTKPDGKYELIINSTGAVSAIDKLRENDTISFALDTMIKHRLDIYPVVNDENEFTGFIEMNNLKHLF